MSTGETSAANPASKTVEVAPWHEIVNEYIISVEHPGIIQNVDKAIASLGGDAKVGAFIQSEKSQRSLGLLLRPEDPFRRPVDSRKIAASNIALRITVPKRTGRKRKRGSDEPFNLAVEDRDIWKRQDVKYMLRSLDDNPKSSQIQAVGVIEEAHRFRALPDFQYSVASSPLAQTLNQTLMKFDYESLSSFKIDSKTKGIQLGIEMIPPPSLSQTAVPFNYAYHQNPSVKYARDNTGKLITTNTSLMPKIATQLVPYDISTIPTGSPSEIPAESTLDPRMRSLITQVRKIMADRPIITRRVLHNRLPRDVIYDLKYALQYVGYMFKSGPWRDCLVSFGVDPRTDPKYRIYQAMSFKIVLIDPKKASKEWADGRVRWNRSQRADQDTDRLSHLFDGNKVTPDGKLWQACDITDPMLRGILEGDTLRIECEIQQDGWYNNGAWAKVRVIMRDKIGLITADPPQVPDDEHYKRVRGIPDVLDDSNVESAVSSGSRSLDGASAKEQNLFAQVRTCAKNLQIMSKRYGVLGASLGGLVESGVGVVRDGDEDVGDGDEDADGDGDDEEVVSGQGEVVGGPDGAEDGEDQDGEEEDDKEEEDVREGEGADDDDDDDDDKDAGEEGEAGSEVESNDDEGDGEDDSENEGEVEGRQPRNYVKFERSMLSS